jgi:hypothetical protein
MLGSASMAQTVTGAMCLMMWFKVSLPQSWSRALSHRRSRPQTSANIDAHRSIVIELDHGPTPRFVAGAFNLAK